MPNTQEHSCTDVSCVLEKVSEKLNGLIKEDCSRRSRALTRCDCPAQLVVRLDRSCGIWYVHNFVDEHNHRLATPDEAPFLWSHRKKKDFLRTEIMSMEAVGIRKHVMMDVLKCRYGGYDAKSNWTYSMSGTGMSSVHFNQS
uniref:Uncharacterized protein n=1 Tax=Arundo donax TaxID=35708 RepID=A0A0A8YY89_ARUDO